MSAPVQNALIAAIVLAAAGFLLWRRLRARRRATRYCTESLGAWRMRLPPPCRRW